MNLVKISCEGYKPFRDRINIDMAPLTIFFGRNNSGKTALLRLPKLLLRCLSSRVRKGFPLDVDELSYGESFRDLIHQKLIHGHIDFSIAIKNDDKTFEVDARIQNISETGIKHDGEEYQVVSRLDISNPALSLQWDGKGGRPPTYENEGVVEFRGLLPDIQDKTKMDFFSHWSQEVRNFEDTITHLSAHRSPVSGSYERNAPRMLGLDGKGAPEWLAKYPQLLEAVGDWYESHMDGWRLSLDITAGVFRCVLRRGNVEVNLTDAGDGMQLLLPVVVQQLLHSLNNYSSFIDIVEEPELHLHPAAHAPLADLFLATADQGRGQVIVETHSENLLLRVRRRIAEGANPGLIALYWVEDRSDGSSSAKRISILENGEVDYWPEGVFSETYHEVRALSRAARAHTADGMDS